MADRLRQVLLEAFSNSGRPLRRVDRADVMIGNSRAKDRRWNGAHGIGPRSKHRRHRPGVRGALAVEHIYELGESPPTREAGTPVGVTFGLATVNRIRGSLLPGAVCSPIPEPDDQHFPLSKSSKSSPALRATHQGACRRRAIDGPQFCLFKSLTPMGLPAATGLARFPADSHLEIEYP